MESINITQIFNIQTLNGIWIAKTTFFSPAKTILEMKGNNEQNAYDKLIEILEIKYKPIEVETLENGNKIYTFLNGTNNKQKEAASYRTIFM